MGDVARRDAAERDADERRARDDRWRDQRVDERAIIVRDASTEASDARPDDARKASIDWIVDQKKREEDDARCGDLCSARARVRRDAWLRYVWGDVLKRWARVRGHWMRLARVRGMDGGRGGLGGTRASRSRGDSGESRGYGCRSRGFCDDVEDYGLTVSLRACARVFDV